MKITDDIKYIGVNDRDVDLFEGQFPVPNGMSYNSYAILDEKIAILDGVDLQYADEWLNSIKTALDGKEPNYLIVHHMEPDHSAGIKLFADTYPEAIIVSSAPAFKMMANFFGTDFADRRIMVKEGSTLELGKHNLKFIGAPLVHWPEVLMSYESSEKIIFSSDAFGKFGVNDIEEPWEDEARRYYIGIVGRFGANVQAVLKKLGALDIKTICPLHGPILNENLGHYIDLYNTWSSYGVESEGVVIAYTSVYGNTKKAALLLEENLKNKNCPAVEVYDLARSDMSKAIAGAFRYGKIVLATTTYNNEIFPFMHDFIMRLLERKFQNRTVAIIENGSWGPTPAKVITKLFEGSKDIEILSPVTIRGALNDATKLQISELANKLV